MIGCQTRRTLLNWETVLSKWIAVFFTTACFLSSSHAQENSWTDGSGNWAQPNWSLGILPGTNQTILLTNSGWKALAIDFNTVSTHPETLGVNAIRISSPVDSFNTLLMNFAGVQNPLNTRSLVVASNSSLVLLNSALNVASSGTEAFSINGFLKAQNSLITAPFISAGALGAGEVDLTNSTLNSPVQFFGGLFPATVNQVGCANTFSSMHLNNCNYNFYGGAAAGDIVIGDNTSGAFHQYSGSFTGTVAIAHGLFELAGGVCSMPSLVIPAITYSTSGSFFQNGGTNNAGPVTVGPYYGGSSGYYALSNGVLNAAGTLVTFFGNFTQAGGINNTHGVLDVKGGIVLKGGGAGYAFYTMYDGMLFSDSLNILIAVFDQSGGTNRTGNLTVGPHFAQSSYDLIGGRLETANTTLYGSFNSHIRNSAGVHIVTNTLTLSGFNNFNALYSLEGGTLQAKDIVISQGVLQHIAGTVNHSGTITLSNGGIWEENTAFQQLGVLQLSGPTNSTINLLAQSNVLHFAASSSLVWSNDATLIIRNWNGSPQGGGAEQISFGSNVSGLTTQQLNQIQFQDPAGFSPGMYSARILSTGEVIPVATAATALLSSAQQSNQLVLHWNTGYTLQTATNINGPFADIVSATSPYTNIMNEPQRFFRLRQ